MGAPKVSRAIFTMSIARTTPAQNPRGLSSNTRFWLGEEETEPPFAMGSSTVKVTAQLYQPAVFEPAPIPAKEPCCQLPATILLVLESRSAWPAGHTFQAQTKK